MAWIVTSVSIDADKEDVGSVSMTWDTGGANEYSWSDRVELTAANRASILARAIADRDAELARRVRGSNLQANFQAYIDAQ